MYCNNNDNNNDSNDSNINDPRRAGRGAQGLGALRRPVEVPGLASAK